MDTFDKLLEAHDHDFTVKHLVDEGVLEDAMTLGFVDDPIAKRIQNRVHEAVELGSDLIVCTCSSIGAVAEAMNPVGSVEIQRIDRAMADEAVRIGNKIILAAALHSTLGPTRELLLSSAKATGKSIDLVEVVVAGAWEQLKAGDKTAYSETIASALNNEAIQGDVIVLAQASMADSASLITRKSIPVLSSPKLGLERAVETLKTKKSN